MATIPSAPDGELIVPDGTEKIPLAKGTLDKFIQALNLVVGRLRETAGPTVLTLGSVLDGEFLQRSGTNIIGGVINPVGYKSLAFNGDMMVLQRGGTGVTSFTGVTSPTYHIDRWLSNITTLGTWTVSQENDAPTGSGLRKSIKFLVTTADAAPVAGASLNLQQRNEGQFLQAIRKGTSSAKQITKSFWVKSNLTGTYIVELFDNDNNRQVSASYTISSANTWELKTITFPADTSGVLDNDNQDSFRFNFWFGAGSNFTSGTLNTAWAAVVNANRAVGQVNLGATINNYIQFAGIQPELGPSSTGFEFIPFDINLLRCKRYYRKSFNYATAPAANVGINTGDIVSTVILAGAVTFRIWVQFDMPMRAVPTTTIYNPQAANNQIRDVGAAADCTGSATNPAENGANFFGVQPAGSAVGNRLSFHYAADVEL